MTTDARFYPHRVNWRDSISMEHAVAIAVVWGSLKRRRAQMWSPQINMVKICHVLFAAASLDVFDLRCFPREFAQYSRCSDVNPVGNMDRRAMFSLIGADRNYVEYAEVLRSIYALEIKTHMGPNGKPYRYSSYSSIRKMAVLVFSAYQSGRMDAIKIAAYRQIRCYATSYYLESKQRGHRPNNKHAWVVLRRI